MVINMLRAANKMLLYPKDENLNVINTKVQCARELIEEIIKGMESPATVTLDKTKPIIEEPSPLTSALEEKEPVYQMDVDHATKALRRMTRDGKSLNPTDLLLIDGKKVEYSKAIGMKFEKLSVVEDA
jgi:hypothetical protein